MAAPAPLDQLDDLSLAGTPDESDMEDGAEAPLQEGTTEGATPASKKKKKKRKTPAQKKASAAAALAAAQAASIPPAPVLKISRNKHMKYISSYHGSWLQLPQEILESLLNVNCDPAALPKVRGLLDTKASLGLLGDRSRFRTLPPPPLPIEMSFLTDGDSPVRLPPPIDPAVFRGVTEIRRLVDDASELSVRAASGMSAAALGAFNLNNGMGGGMGDSGMGGRGGGGGGGGRDVAMSPVRQHRLRGMAVQRLAQAYRIDEIAASVAVMQGATGLDDIAQRVLKQDPSNLDAQYVHFFHEKIPSRTLAVSTDTSVLDQLIAHDSNRLEFYRTRAIIHGFKQDFPASILDFTRALTLAKAVRKAKEHQHEVATNGGGGRGRKKGRGGKSSSKGKTSRPVAYDSDSTDSPSTSASTPARDEEIGKEPGDDLERQMLFHRGMANFAFACKLVEETVLDIEGVPKPAGGLSNEGGELTLRNVGIVLKDEAAGLYGSAPTSKQAQYRSILGDSTLKDKVTTLLRKSLRDHERFLSYFGVFEAPAGSALEEDKRYDSPRSTDRPLVFRGRRLIHHRSLSNRSHHTDPRRPEVRNGQLKPQPALLTTYHPLLIESHFVVLLAHLLLGDFATLATAHERTIRLMDHLEGYPAFLPARSLNQSEYAEVLERLAAQPWLRKRESEGKTSLGEVESDEGQHSGAIEDLQSLHQLLNLFTPEFVKVLVEQAEQAQQEKKQEAKAKASSNSMMALLEDAANGGGDTKMGTSTWAEEREKAEAERRKIDPSYATFNTARAECALAWLVAAVLPEKEAQEKIELETRGPVAPAGKGKGKASTEGAGSPSTPSVSASSSFAGGSGSRTNGGASTSK